MVYRRAGVRRWWVVVAVMVCCGGVHDFTEAQQLLHQQFRHRGAWIGQGDVLLSVTVRSSVSCSSLCVPGACVGYSLSTTTGGYECTTFTNVTGYTENVNYKYYCAGCLYKGETCTMTTECSNMALYAVCDTNTSTCTCPDYTEDDGMDCKLKASKINEACILDDQCLLISNHTACQSYKCQCVSDFIADGDQCVYDYTGSGFSMVHGRWIYHRPGGLFGMISWDNGRQYCQDRQATMFKPRSSAEWDWLNTEVKSKGSEGVFMPINDIQSEGTVVWNDGSSTSGASYLKWNGLSFNSILFNCVSMSASEYIPFIPDIPAQLSYITCYIPFLYSVVCEAEP